MLFCVIRSAYNQQSHKYQSSREILTQHTITPSAKTPGHSFSDLLPVITAFLLFVFLVNSPECSKLRESGGKRPAPVQKDINRERVSVMASVCAKGLCLV